MSNNESYKKSQHNLNEDNSDTDHDDSSFGDDKSKNSSMTEIPRKRRSRSGSKNHQQHSNIPIILQFLSSPQGFILTDLVLLCIVITTWNLTSYWMESKRLDFLQFKQIAESNEKQEFNKAVLKPAFETYTKVTPGLLWGETREVTQQVTTVAERYARQGKNIFEVTQEGGNVNGRRGLLDDSEKYDEV